LTDLRDVQQLERWFWRAPSAHNTQPWVLDYESDRIELRFDPLRHLEAGDPTRRDLFLSLGAIVEAVLIAAASNGVGLEFTPAVEVGASRVGTFTEAAAIYETSFTPADLDRRRTSRLPYVPGRVGEDDLAAARAELAPGERLHELEAHEIAPLFTAADRHLFDTPPVVRELRSWLRLSKRDPNYERDGLSYECLALSRLEAALFGLALRPRLFRVVRALRLHRTFTSSAASVLDVDGSVLVLDAPDGPLSDLLSRGRSLLRIWLALSARGLYTHPLSQVIDYPATERELANRLSLGAERRIVSVFRAGRSDVPARSHRLVRA
jgi:hypothetical protein